MGKLVCTIPSQDMKYLGIFVCFSLLGPHNARPSRAPVNAVGLCLRPPSGVSGKLAQR
jgi:hypothetical protein